MTNKFDRIHTNTNRKYIIRNCPACYDYEGKYGCEDNHDEQGRDTYCELVTDCVLKQIVELCKDIDCPCEYQGVDCWECTEGGARRFANKILKLLDIQEGNR